MTMRKVFAFLIIFSLLSAMILALSATTTAHVVGVIATIRVGSEPYAVAYDSGKGEIFVTNIHDTSVSVISDSNNTVVATIPVGYFPSGVAYDSGKDEVFVANVAGSGEARVSVISDINNTVIANIPLHYVVISSTELTVTAGVAYDSGKDEVFVANNLAGTVSVISDSNNTVVATIPVGDHPLGVAYDSGKGEVFVANNNDGTVSVISDSNNTVIATIPVGLAPAWVAYDAGKGEVFVTNSGDNTTSVISDSTHTVTATIPVGGSPQGVAYDSGKGEIFVATNRGNYLNGTVSVISDITNTVTETIPAGIGPYGVAYDSGKSEIFVTNRYAYFNVMSPPTISDTVLVISDSYPLAAPSVFPSPGTVHQGQTSNLTSTALTTGVPPYVYRWFSEAPNASSYSPISNATSSSYSFETSASTAMGNWSFVLQVTDGTQAAVNSTAVTVTVDAALPPRFNETLITALLTVIAVVAVGTVLLIYFKKRKHQ
jgi:YVTN family beta-propeller protein